MKADRTKALTLLSLVAVAAILSGVASIVNAADNGEQSSNDLAQQVTGTCGWGGGWLGGWGRGQLRVGGRYGFVEVSEQFQENAISIAKSDEDVQKLLDDGYNVTVVRPIIKATVEANGDVVTKATSAVVMLQKDTTGMASVSVDLEQGKVTRIVILTRTVIEKS